MAVANMLKNPRGFFLNRFKLFKLEEALTPQVVCGLAKRCTRGVVEPKFDTLPDPTAYYFLCPSSLSGS